MEYLLLSCIKYRVENNQSLYGRFQLGPFDKGQGLTVANAMRRTLLSELSGLSILCVEIQGVAHEYSNLKGVRESVLDILLNLKQIIFISDKKFTKPQIGFLKMQGPHILKSGDLKLPPFMRCVDSEQYIATLSDNGVLEMKFMIFEGKNFSVETSSELLEKHFTSHFYTKKENEVNLYHQINSVEDFLKNNAQKNKSKNTIETIVSNTKHHNQPKTLFPVNKINFQKFEKNFSSDKKKLEFQSLYNLDNKTKKKKTKNTNLLFIDPVFMPIKKVNFSIQNIFNYSEPKKFDKVTKFHKDYSKEKIILEIWTDGSIHPKHAIHQAADKIIDIFFPLQKNYFLKKTKLITKPIINDKTFFYSSTKIENNTSAKNVLLSDNQPVIHFFKQKFGSENQKNVHSFSNLSKIYRPWLSSSKLINSKNNFFTKEKKNIENIENIQYLYDKNSKYKKWFEYKLKSIDITHLNLSTKAYICLKRANINTIGDLLSYSRNELLLIKNLKEKSIKQIEFFLAQMNFKLRTEIS